MTEDEYMLAIRANFQVRCQSLDIKSKKAKEQEAGCFMQGALIALTTTGIMTVERAGQIGFLFLVGRGAEFLEIRE